MWEASLDGLLHVLQPHLLLLGFLGILLGSAVAILPGISNDISYIFSKMGSVVSAANAA